MNTLILMGRGIEGAGNTRLSIEIEEYLRSEGHQVTIIANSEKIWPRGKMHVNDIETHDFRVRPYLNKEYPFPSKFDNVIVMSVPASKFSDEGKENFTKTLELFINLPMTYIQVDHKLASINRNYYGKEPYTTRFFRCIDRTLTNCIDNDFLKKFVARKVDVEKTGELDVNGIVMISADFDSIPKGNVNDRVEKTIHFIGRSPAWKGWIDLAKFHQSHLQELGYATQIEGIEMSIGTVGAVFEQTKPERIPFDYFWLGYKHDPNEELEHRDIPAQLYGPYVRNEAIDRICKSKFAAFTTFVGEQFGGMIEAAFLEMAATKTPVIIKKELYEGGILNHGERISNFTPKEMGIIVWDMDNPQGAINVLEDLNKHQEEYEQYTENVYNFWKSRFDRQVMLPMIINEVIKPSTKVVPELIEDVQFLPALEQETVEDPTPPRDDANYIKLQEFVEKHLPMPYGLQFEPGEIHLVKVSRYITEEDKIAEIRNMQAFVDFMKIVKETKDNE